MQNLTYFPYFYLANVPFSTCLCSSLFSCSLSPSRTFFAASFLVADEGDASPLYRMIPSCISLQNCHDIVFFELCTNWTWILNSANGIYITSSHSIIHTKKHDLTTWNVYIGLIGLQALSFYNEPFYLSHIGGHHICWISSPFWQLEFFRKIMLISTQWIYGIVFAQN